MVRAAQEARTAERRTGTEREIRHAHLFCGLGAAARGFNRGEARVGSLKAKFRCLGGIDFSPAAIADFGRLAGVPGTCMDLFSRAQYIDFHGREPGPDWRERLPSDLHAAFGNERPHIMFLSAPCKGFSGLLSETSSKTAKYQALNALTLRGVWLMLEAYRDDPVDLVVFENVPRIASRGRPLLDRIIALLRQYGYAVAETTHDCGELGGLAQSRKRFLLVARHQDKVPPFVYEPPKRPLLGVGDVLDTLPVPGPEPVLPMHRMPSLQWKTWVRLAFVKAGSDWRSLNDLAVEDGFLRDFAIVGERHGGYLGVHDWGDSTGVVSGRGTPTTGAYSVADPRVDGHPKSVQLGVRPWDRPSGVVTSKMLAGGGPHSVADPRAGPGFGGKGKYRVTRIDEPAGTVIGASTTGQGAFALADPRLGGVRFNNVFRVVGYGETSPAVTGGGMPSAGGLGVADPRCNWSPSAHRNKLAVADWESHAGTVTGSRAPYSGGGSVADPRCNGYRPNAFHNKLSVQGWDAPSKTVTGGQHVQSGALSVADPRPDFARDGRDAYLTGGHYGVVDWKSESGTVSGSARHDNGRWSVADPRVAACSDQGAASSLPAPNDRLFAVIRALDGTWHRPFTTLELAALQGLVDPHEVLELDGLSDSAWRERIGNAVPPPAAKAIADTMGQTLLLAWSGETFMLSNEPIWVRNLAVGIAVRGQTTGDRP